MATLCETSDDDAAMVNGGITSGRVTAYSLPALSINAPTCVYTLGSVYMYVDSLYHDMHDSATARKNRENPGGAALARPAPWLCRWVGSLCVWWSSGPSRLVAVQPRR